MLIEVNFTEAMLVVPRRVLLALANTIWDWKINGKLVSWSLPGDRQSVARVLGVTGPTMQIS